MPQTRKSDKNSEQEQIDDTEDEVSQKVFQAKVADRWVFIMNNNIIQHDSNTENKPTICALKHPKSGQKSLYLFCHNDTEVYEIKQFKEEYRSWFIGDQVQNDGSLYITTAVDPIFLVLPYLREAEKSGKYMTLDQIVVDEDYSESHRLLSTPLTDLHLITDSKVIDEEYYESQRLLTTPLTNLHLITDSKGDDDFKAYKYNGDKTLSWLKVKTEQVVSALRKANIVPSGSRSADLIKSTKDTGDDDEYLKYAFGIVSDYLPLELSSSLQEYLCIPTVSEKRPTDSPNPPAKRAKLEDITPLEDYSKNVTVEAKPVGKQTQAQKKLDKVDKKGMKSMMSFFSPKPK